MNRLSLGYTNCQKLTLGTHAHEGYGILCLIVTTLLPAYKIFMQQSERTCQFCTKLQRFLIKGFY